MQESAPRNDPEMQARIAQLFASDENPNGYYVSADTLLEVIKKVDGIAEKTRDEVLAAVQKLIVSGKFIDALQFGIAIERLMNEASDSEDILKIAKKIDDLGRIPIVNNGHL